MTDTNRYASYIKGFDRSEAIKECLEEYPEAEVEGGDIRLRLGRVVLEHGGTSYDLGNLSLEISIHGRCDVVGDETEGYNRRVWKEGLSDGTVRPVHPNVSATGHLCLGRYADSYYAALGENRFGDCLSIAAGVVRGYGEAAWIPLVFWHPDRRMNRCKTCNGAWFGIEESSVCSGCEWIERGEQQ